jgi:hypothetical protein
MPRLPRAVLPVCHGTGWAVDGGRHDAGLRADHANTKKTLSKYDTGAQVTVRFGYKRSRRSNAF